MGFPEFTDDYLKITVPETRLDMLNSISNLIEKNNLSFFATQYKNESDEDWEAGIKIENYLVISRIIHFCF